MRSLLLFILLVVALVSCRQQDTEEKLHVHLIPHAHCDPGWLLTVEQYYDQAVSHILDTVTETLSDHPDRRFIWVETSFFSLWWNRTTEQHRTQWRKLLERRQVEFILGGWVMNDEAVTTYTSNIEQMTHGHRFLKETFGELGIPRIGWDIDPFGMSQTNARMYKDMGFDYHVINRIDYRVKEQMIKESTLEFNWNVRDGKSILTHVLYNHYGTPFGFEWEGSYPCCGVDFKDNPIITAENVAERSQVFVNIVKNRAKSFRTNHLLVPFGNDFEFRNASINFGNMTQIVNFINSNLSEKYGVVVKYSLLSEYFDSIRSESGKFPSYDYDFFPYADNNVSYWTGYFTSRPEVKYFARVGQQIARNTEFLFALAQRKNSSTLAFQEGYERISSLRTGNAYIQHHDAITGTEKPAVIQMYINYILDGLKQVKSLAHSSIQALLVKANLPPIQFTQGNVFIESRSATSLPIIMFNSLGWSRSQIMIILTQTSNITIFNEKKENIPFYARPLGTWYEISFEASIPALSLVTYSVQFSSNSRLQIASENTKQASNSFTVSNPVYSVEFCAFGTNDVRICSISNRISGVSAKVEQNFMQYTSMTSNDTQDSGAYIFRSIDAVKSRVSNSVKTVVTNTKFYTEITQEFSSFVKQRIRLYNSLDKTEASNNNFIDIEIELGELPENREIVALFKTNLQNAGTLYTDSSDYFTMKRTRVNDPNPSANYYPTQSSSYIKDKQAQFTVISSESRGVASLLDGEIEYMLHRRTTVDDSRGLGTPLNDTTKTTITLRLILDSPDRSVALRHTQSRLLDYPTMIYTVDLDSPTLRQLGLVDYANLFSSSYSAVTKDLPLKVHLETLQAHTQSNPDVVLMRLRHLYDQSEDDGTEVIQVDKWFDQSQFAIKFYTEMKLSANQKLSSNEKRREAWLTPFQVTLTPNQIRTFELDMH